MWLIISQFSGVLVVQQAPVCCLSVLMCSHIAVLATQIECSVHKRAWAVKILQHHWPGSILQPGTNEKSVYHSFSLHLSHIHAVQLLLLPIAAMQSLAHRSAQVAAPARRPVASRAGRPVLRQMNVHCERPRIVIARAAEVQAHRDVQTWTRSLVRIDC